MNKNIQGHLFALTANILWGLMAPVGKSALVEFSALSVTTFRMVGAAACFWLLSLFCKREQVDHRDMLKIFFASLFALVFNQGVYIFGLSMTSPIDASIVTTTLPIVTMIVAAVYLKEPFPTTYTLTLEESAELRPLQSDLGRYVDESLARFVLGETDLNDDTIAEFRQTIREKGMQEMIDFWQRVALRTQE